MTRHNEQRYGAELDEQRASPRVRGGATLATVATPDALESRVRWWAQPGSLTKHWRILQPVIGQRVMDWRAYIHSDPDILDGKPVVKGTRLAVEFILGLFAAGWTEQQVLENYPTLTPDAIRAVFGFAAECMREEALYSLAG